mgnify:FL=1
MSKNPVEASTKTDSGAGCLLRLFWMAFGNILLFCTLGLLLKNKPAFPSLFDAAIAVILLLLVLARFLDIRFCKGQTANDTPADMSHWRRYALIVSASGGLLWGVTRGLIYWLSV